MIWVTFAGGDFGWWSWQTAAFLGATAVLLVLTVVWELRVPEPLVPLRLLANRTAILVIVASIAVGIGMFGGTTFLGQYFQLARGYTPTHAGLLTIPLMAAMLPPRRSAVRSSAGPVGGSASWSAAPSC